MKSSEDINQSDASNLILFKGDAMTRKTANAGSWRPSEPMAIFDLDGKCASIKIAHPVRKFEWEYYSPNDFNKFDRDLSSLQDKNPYKGGTIVVDSITSYVKMSLRHMSNATGGAAIDVNKNKGAKVVAGVRLMGWDEYNFEAQAIDNLISLLKIISKDTAVILIAHTQGAPTEKVVAGEKVVHRQLFTAGNKPAIYIPSQFKEIYHFYCKVSMIPNAPADYVVRTQNTGIDYASTFIPNLPAEIDVTKGDLYQTIEKYITKKEDVKK